MGVSDRDVYLHTLPMFHCNGWGMPYAVTGMGGRHIVLRKVDGAEILRRVERARRHAAVRRAGGASRMVLDAAAAWDGPIPGRGRDAHRRRRRAAAHAHDRARRDRARLGVHPDLRPHRDGAAADDEPAREPSATTSTPPSARSELGRAGAPALGVRDERSSDEGEVLAREQRRDGGLLGAARGRRPTRSHDGWFHTGDGGSIDDEHYLTISDRKKDVIISGGENVARSRSRTRSSRIPAVAEVAVIGVPDEKWGETVMALVVLAPGATLTEDELIAHCQAAARHYKCPTKVEFRTELARTATGKLQKFKLRAPYWDGRTRQVN